MNDDRFVGLVVDYLVDYIKEYRKLIRAQYADLHWDTKTMTDEMHARWFTMMAQQNPNWVVALPFVEGGMAELSRFERTVGLGRYAVQPAMTED